MVQNVALGRPVTEPVVNSAAATDGRVTGYTGEEGFAYFQWPGYLTVDLGQLRDLVTIRLLLWDNRGDGRETPDPRGYKYRLLTSADGQTWNVLFDTNGDSYNGWQMFNLNGPLRTRHVRVHGLHNSANDWFHIVELEGYEEPPPTDVAPTLEREVGIGTLSLEDGDGFPLQHSVDSLVDALEELIAGNTLLNPKPFREVIAQLRLRVSDISAVEKRMGAVRRQLLEPVASQLEEGRKYSLWSVRLGLAGGVIGLVSLVLYVLDKLLSK